MRFSHLTLSTGDFATFGCDDVDPVLIDHWLSVIDARSGSVPGHPDLRLFVVRPVRQAAYFHLTSDLDVPVNGAIACWGDAVEDDMWQMVQRNYERLHDGLCPLGLWHPISARPPALPWLVAWHTPDIMSMTEEQIARLGRIEQAVTCTLVI